RCARDLHAALGNPPIRWIDTGHYGLFLGARSAMDASAAYLNNVWSEAPKEESDAPRVAAPTIKAGLIFGLDSIVTPAIQWQAYTFLRRRDRMSLLHADLG